MIFVKNRPLYPLSLESTKPSDISKYLIDLAGSEEKSKRSPESGSGKGLCEVRNLFPNPNFQFYQLRFEHITFNIN